MDNVNVQIGQIEVAVKEHDRRINDNKNYSKENRRMISDNSEKITNLSFSQIEHQTKMDGAMKYVRGELKSLKRIGIGILIGLVIFVFKEMILKGIGG